MTDRIARFVCNALDSIDARLDHWAGCGLLNRRILLLYDEPRDRFRIDLPSPTYRLYWWATDRNPCETCGVRGWRCDCPPEPWPEDDS